MTKETRIPLTELAEEKFRKGYKSSEGENSDQITFRSFNREEYKFILRSSDEFRVVADIAKKDYKSFEELIAKPISKKRAVKFNSLVDVEKRNDVYSDYQSELEETYDYYLKASKAIFGEADIEWRDKLKRYKIWLYNLRLAEKIEQSIRQQVYNSKLEVDFVDLRTGLPASFQDIKSLLINDTHEFAFDKSVKEFLIKPTDRRKKTFMVYIGNKKEVLADEEKKVVIDGRNIKKLKEPKGDKLLTLSYEDRELSINGWVIHKTTEGCVPDNLLKFLMNPNRQNLIWPKDELVKHNVYKTTNGYNKKNEYKVVAQKFTASLDSLKLVGSGNYYRVGSLFFYRSANLISLRNPIYTSHIAEYNKSDPDYVKNGFKDDQIIYEDLEGLLSKLKEPLKEDGRKLVKPRINSKNQEGDRKK